MAVLNGKRLTPKQYAAWKKKQEAEIKQFWQSQVKKLRTEKAALKKRYTSAKKLPIKVKATAIQMRIREIDATINRLQKK